MAKQKPIQEEQNPLWYKDAIIYEVHIRAFHDSDGDGIGDFKGLTEKLDYLQDLGITAIWLLPFYPSPLRDDGYDIASYTEVNPMYGSLQHFKTFIREAHRRGLRVITELVCNHTSDQHPWFQRARTASPGTPHRNYYVWNDTPDKYTETRIIFKDFETSNWTWDPVAKAYYWHRFYHHQPDLNFDNPRVRKEIFKAMDFWLQMGVDGMRLDAIPYLYEREGTNCENLPETHTFLKELRRHVDSKFHDRMLLAEANQWPEDAVQYFGSGDECHMSFHFPLMPRLFMAVYMEDRFPILDILKQTPAIPDTAQWALFLRNHDELTLEMVTDEERDYMYRMYASDPAARINLGIRRRLAPLLQNNRRRIELMNGLLFSLPGTPVLYYGDEIGMGDNIYLGDRDGVRTPMQWSPDRNAGFSAANHQRLYLPIITDPEYHYEAVNVDTQQHNPSSLLWWMKRLIALRKRYKAFGRGSIAFFHPENQKVLAFLRRYEDETILVVANLSRFSQAVELDLSRLQGLVPIEMFGRVKFPPIGEQPYFITLGPHNFFFFSLEPHVPSDTAPDKPISLPVLSLKGESWEALFTSARRGMLTDAIQRTVQNHRWFGGKARTIRDAQIIASVPLSYNHSTAFMTLVQINYLDGIPETYVLPLAYAEGGQAADVLAYGFATIRDEHGEGLLYDALRNDLFCATLLDMIAHPRHLNGETNRLVSTHTNLFRKIRGAISVALQPAWMGGEQSNTSVKYGDQLILKLFRRVEEGINPDLEIGHFLTRAGFAHIAPVVGSIAYARSKTNLMTLAVAQQFVPNQGDAWTYTLKELDRYLENAISEHEQGIPDTFANRSLVEMARHEPAPETGQIIGPYLSSARLLGQRTAELHLALCSDPDNPDFAPEPFTALYQRSLAQTMCQRTDRTFLLLQKTQHLLPEHLREDVVTLLALKDTIIARFQAVQTRKISVMRTRCHGDYHLGQVLFTGSDFIIIDFEGEPALSLTERRIKRSPFTDVAGMLRSFDYASYWARDAYQERYRREEDRPALDRWAQFWCDHVSATFLHAYLTTAQGAPFVPSDDAELSPLLETYLLNKAVYELGYELNNRPTKNWVSIPIRSLLRMVKM